MGLETPQRLLIQQLVAGNLPGEYRWRDAATGRKARPAGGDTGAASAASPISDGGGGFLDMRLDH
jgi:hypothetical protein